MIRYLRSRTILVSVLIAMFGAMEAILPSLGVYLSPWQHGLATVITAGIMALLRALTTQPLTARVDAGAGGDDAA